MKETLSKMAELKFEAPLAQFEEADEWQSADFCLKKSRMRVVQNTNPTADAVTATNINVVAVTNKQHEDDCCPFEDTEYAAVFSDSNTTEKMVDSVVSDAVNNNVLGDNFAETVSGSLEDLVNTFDEKITRCFHNYQESVEKLAPVQVRSQEEIMNECQ